MPVDPLFLGLALVVIGLALILVEVLIPSHGLISILALICVIVGIAFLWKHSMVWGISGMLAVMVLGPAVAAFALKILPNTPMGRRMFGEMPEDLVETERRAKEEHTQKMATLVSRTGKAITPLRPIGTIEIDGERFEALAELGAIERGDTVRVSAIVDNQIKVRIHKESTDTLSQA
ncbi:MAG: hypothetical protein H6815_12430 [Phycisphaeraceae bacterium]|nr:hypothetical protein [Phycisphaerales bacterium]MCB9861247.1 hypothetical protein [Phycisphaeraceae bacterium]